MQQRYPLKPLCLLVLQTLACHAYAADAADDSAAVGALAGPVQTVEITGRGQSRQVQNIGSVSVSQGAGALGTASSSNLGGTVQFYTLAPSDERGLTFAQTLGSDSTSRTFARVDTGLVNGVFKAYLSGTRQRTEKTKGS